MKLLVFAALLYFAYRLYLKPFLLSPRDAERKQPLHNPDPGETNDDYIDYEEVD